MNIIEQHRAITHYRAAFHDMPVAGPMDGAAYGEYLKSKGLGMIIGVVSAAAAVVTGGATLAAWATASTAQLISAGAMVAGGVMSGVGAVTGNQKLMKIGGVLSLAGGIGGALNGTAFSKGLVSGVDASGAGASAAAEAGSTAAAGLEAGKEVAVEGAVAADSTAGTLKLADAFSNAGVSPASEGAGILQGETVSSMAADAASGAQSAATPSVAQAAADASAVPGAQNGVLTTVAKNAPAQQQAGALQLTPTDSSFPATEAAARGELYGPAQQAGSTSYMDKGMGILKGAGSFFKDNKELVEIAGKTLQGVGAEGQAGSKELQSANANATNATADATRQAMDLKAQQAANANTVVIQLDPRDPQYAQKKAAAEAAGRKTVDIAGAAQNGPVTMAGVNYGQTTNQWAASPNNNINVPRGMRAATR